MTTTQAMSDAGFKNPPGLQAQMDHIESGECKVNDFNYTEEEKAEYLKVYQSFEELM